METGIFHQIFLIYKNLVFISSREEDVGAKYKYNSGLEGKYRNIYINQISSHHTTERHSVSKNLLHQNLK